MATPSPSQSPEQMQAELLNGPAAKPPVGVVPNFVDPTNLDTAVITVLSVCLIIGTLAVLIRTYTKLMLIKSIAYEDYVILLAWLGLIGFVTPSIFDYQVLGGIHMWDVRLKDFFRFLYWVHVTTIVYAITICLIKLSILLQYLRIFVPHRQCNLTLFVIIHALMWTIFIFYLISTAFGIAICTPRKKIWNPLMKTGHCFNDNANYLASGIFNVVSDFAILIVPMIPICKLQMPLRRKFMMIALFATGLCACVASILRTYYTFKIVQSSDVSYYTIVMGLWTWAELSSGILISCLPIMPKFFQHLGNKLRGAFATLSKRSFRSRSTNTSRSIARPATFRAPLQDHRHGDGNSENLDGPFVEQAGHKGRYITLSDIDACQV